MARRILRELKLDKIAAVDRPCQEGATMTIMKRNFSDEERQHLADTGAAMPDGSFPIANEQDLKNAIHAIGRAKDPEAAKKHIISRAKSLGKTELLPDGWVSKAAPKGNNPDHEGDDDMDENEMKTKVAGLEKSVSDLTKRAEKAEADLAKANTTIEALTQAAEIAKSDETFSADGVTIRKSEVGVSSFKFMKAQQERIELADMQKRAEAEIGHLPGETIAKAKVLKAIAKMSDEDKAVLDTMLKAGEAAIVNGFAKFGVPTGGANADDPLAKLADMAKAKSEKDGTTYHKAYNAVLDTPEGKRLYAEHKAH